MSTLLLRLAAPLQAWGINSKFDIRKTEREPSKSGVVGLLAAALGRRRDESLDDLAALKFGIRSDKEGELLKDFHMVLKDKKTSYVTTRYYLADAIFLVGSEHRIKRFGQIFLINRICLLFQCVSYNSHGVRILFTFDTLLLPF